MVVYIVLLLFEVKHVQPCLLTGTTVWLNISLTHKVYLNLICYVL